MARPCSVCSSPDLPAICADLVNGVGLVEVARRYGLTKSAVQRHRTHAGIAARPAIQAQRTAAFTALAALPTADQVGQAYAGIAIRLDAIVSQCEADGSAATAISGLKEMRAIIDMQSRLAGHVGPSPSAPTVNVNTQVNVDAAGIVEALVAAITTSTDKDAAIDRLAKVIDGPTSP